VSGFCRNKKILLVDMEELNDAESGSCKLEEFLFVRMMTMLENMFGRVFAVKYGMCWRGSHHGDEM
jgi:hypothetical protein